MGRGLAGFAAIWVVTGAVVTGGAGAALARWRWRRPPGETVVAALCASYANAGNLGIPIAAYVLGDVAAVAPVLLLQSLVVAPLALAALDRADRSARPPFRWRCSPSGWRWRTAAPTRPTARPATGPGRPARRSRPRTPWWCSRRWRIRRWPTWRARLLGLGGAALLAATVTAALPTAQNVYVYAARYARAEPLARDTVVISTLVAAATTGVLAAWLG